MLDQIRGFFKYTAMALDKHASPNDVIEGFEDALDAYEELINQYHQK